VPRQVPAVRTASRFSTRRKRSTASLRIRRATSQGSAISFAASMGSARSTSPCSWRIGRCTRTANSRATALMVSSRIRVTFCRSSTRTEAARVKGSIPCNTSEKRRGSDRCGGRNRHRVGRRGTGALARCDDNTSCDATGFGGQGDRLAQNTRECKRELRQQPLAHVELVLAVKAARQNPNSFHSPSPVVYLRSRAATILGRTSE